MTKAGFLEWLDDVLFIFELVVLVLLCYVSYGLHKVRVLFGREED